MLALHEAGAQWAVPFLLMERLVQSDTPYSEHARALRSEVVHVAGAGFDWLDAELPGQIADEINLTNYEILPHTSERRTSLSRALERLAAVHPEGFDRVREFVRGLLWVGLKSSVHTSSLTSSSDPALPYVIVFSEKALHHIPPNTATPKPGSPADSWRTGAEPKPPRSPTRSAPQWPPSSCPIRMRSLPMTRTSPTGWRSWQSSLRTAPPSGCTAAWKPLSARCTDARERAASRSRPPWMHSLRSPPPMPPQRRPDGNSTGRSQPTVWRRSPAAWRNSLPFRRPPTPEG
ncbi:hypothetical protein ACFVXQ_08255 [Kitasatospora sp. NPDC058263]